METIDIIKAIGGGIIALATIVQIAPVQINPWSWLAKTVGRAINGELIKEVGDIKDGMAKMGEDLEKQRALDSRWRIIRFNDELLQAKRHSKECFDQVLEDITAYTKYCEEHRDFKNEKAKMAIENVERCYRKCMEDRDFL
jgi:hypothetical protein